MSLPRGIPAASLKREVKEVLELVRLGLPRGIPAASFEACRRPAQRRSAVGLPRGGRSSAGNTRGLIEATRPRRMRAELTSSAGNTRGLIEARFRPDVVHSYLDTASSAGNTRGLIEANRTSAGVGKRHRRSSAGNTRGLIEAITGISPTIRACPSLPRGIPAASLKHVEYGQQQQRGASLPRGIPAASLKRSRHRDEQGRRRESSAGNTRGLIEASLGARPRLSRPCLPRGIPAASLKQHQCAGEPAGDVAVFRGEYPRPY